MARKREFDPHDALDKAMRIFWQKGYANTSIRDLVNATGVNRYGLYDEFGSKHGLYLATLDHYQDSVAGMLFRIVERQGASLPDIHDYFARLVEYSTTESGKQGCMMANCATEVAPFYKAAAIKVEEFRRRLQLGFKNALQNAKTRGELPSGTDIDKVVDFLTGITYGTSVMARSLTESKTMVNVVEIALSGL